MRRVIAGRLDGAPHETLLVVDATTGQNGLAAGAPLRRGRRRHRRRPDEARRLGEGRRRDPDRLRARPAGEADRRRRGPRRPAPVRPARLRARARAPADPPTAGLGPGTCRCRGPRSVPASPTGALPAGRRSRLGSPVTRGWAGEAPVHWSPCSTRFPTSSSTRSATCAGAASLDEEAVSRAMREVRLALLEADVNFDVVKAFVARVRERALGEDVGKSLTPGQQVVKIVHEELTELMGSGASKLAFSPRPPTTILLAGLQGSGKTTAAGKLALLLKDDGRKPALVAADLQRPAAIDQLIQLGAPGRRPRLRRRARRPGQGRPRRDRAGARRRPRRRHPRHRRPAAHRRGADGGARRGAPRGQADERPARPRRDDRPGGRERREGLPGADRLRRRRDDEARRRRARRRGALGQGGHRPPDQARVGRRAPRRARVVPPRPDGVADPRHGRRADADRAGRGGGRRRREGGARAPPDEGRVQLRRLPLQLQDAPPDGAAPGRPAS